MFKVTSSRKLFMMCAGRSVSSLAVQDIRKILDSHLKIDDNAMKKINNLKLDTVITKIPKSQIIQNCTLMQSMSVNVEKIEFLAQCLMLQPMVMRNRINILQEMGVKSIGLDTIYRFPSSMRKSLKGFKKRHGIPQEQNIMETIFKNLGVRLEGNDIPLIDISHNEKASSYYQICMFYYKMVHLKLNGDMCNKRRKLKYQSFSETSVLVNLLKAECNFDSKFIKRYPQLLNLDLNNVKEFLGTFKHMNINGKKIVDLLKSYPFMLFYDADKVKELLHLQQALGIPNRGIRACPRVLGMSKDVFLERCMNIANSDVLGLWLHHPRALHMIYRYSLVQSRIHYLKPLNCVNNASIQTYLCQQKMFLKFVEGDMERLSIKKNFIYILCKELGESKASLMDSIQKHPYWKYVPLLHIEKMLRYLKKHFFIEDICDNIHIILYPRSKVVQVLNSLQNEYSPKSGYHFTPAQYLSLCLYTLEKKYHFSGDAVWQSVHTEMSDLNPDLFTDLEDSTSDNLIECINAPEGEILSVSGAAWLEYLLR